jgi:muconate cycloisomerase/chloromuconate cycloisomerase
MEKTFSDTLRVCEIEALPLFIPFKRPHKISLGQAGGREIVVLEVKTKNGIIGLGEAVSHPAFSGETLESLQGAVQYLAECVIGENALHLNKINALMDERLYGNYGAKAAIEMALFDIVGKYFQVPVYDLLGGKMREKLPLSRSASQSDMKKDLDDVREFMREGYKIIKVKVGLLPVKQDVQRIETIRETAGPGVSLRADANQGWSVPDAHEFIRGVQGSKLDFIEQPIAQWNLDGLAYLRSKSSIPIMADEAAITEHDVLEIIKRGAADLISVKVLKSGGIMRARRIISIAENGGIQCYLGSQIETSVGTSASLHCALSTGSFTYGGEIYGPVFFVEDIAKKPIRIEDGYMYPPDEPGLGVELDQARLKDFAHKPR